MTRMRATLGAFMAVLLAFSCGESDFTALVEEGRSDLQKGNADTAIAQLEEALSLPRDGEPSAIDAKTRARAMRDLVVAYVRVGQSDKAHAGFNQFVSAYPTRANLASYTQLVAECQSAKRYADAVHFLQAAIDRFPEQAGPLVKKMDELATQAAKAGDSGALDSLRSLGYVGD